jgi:hypothetical protein
MFVSAILLLGSSAALPKESVVFKPNPHIQTKTVQLGDIAELASLPQALRLRASRLVLFRMADHQKSLRVTRVQLASRARSLMPVLRFWLADLPTAGDIVIRRGNPSNGEMIVAPGTAGKVAKGEGVTFHVRAGIFDIARNGTALQEAMTGEHLFVRTEDNTLVSACLCGDGK